MRPCSAGFHVFPGKGSAQHALRSCTGDGVGKRFSDECLSLAEQDPVIRAVAEPLYRNSRLASLEHNLIGQASDSYMVITGPGPQLDVSLPA